VRVTFAKGHGVARIISIETDKRLKASSSSSSPSLHDLDDADDKDGDSGTHNKE
jgi:hypothetical protein